MGAAARSTAMTTESLSLIRNLRFGFSIRGYCTPTRSVGVPVGARIPIQLREGLRGFLDFSVLNARGADSNALGRSRHHRVHALKVQIPAPLSQVVGVADAISKPRPASTDFTHFRHIRGLLLIDSYELSTTAYLIG